MLSNQNQNLTRYWLDLFTGATWQAFRQAGATVSGFSERRRNLASHLQAGDILLRYLTGVTRWIGALEVVGPSQDARSIWQGQDFPVRFAVKPLVLLDPECGVPMDKLAGQVAFYADAKDAGKFKGFVRGSPRLRLCMDQGDDGRSPMRRVSAETRADWRAGDRQGGERCFLVLGPSRQRPFQRSAVIAIRNG